MNICRNMRMICSLFPPRRNSGDAALYTPGIPGDMGVGDFGFRYSCRPLIVDQNSDK